MSSFEKVRPGINPLFLSQNMAQKLTEKPNELKKNIHNAVKDSLIKQVKQGLLHIGFTSDNYLPEKKIPSIQAKATSLSANEFELHFMK